MEGRGRRSVFLLLMASVVFASQQNEPSHHAIAKDNLEPPQISSRVRPDEMSLTLSPGPDQAAADDFQAGFIVVHEPPALAVVGTPLTLFYRCVGNKSVGVQISVRTEHQDDALAFYRSWNCSQRSPNQHERRQVTLRLPANLAYRPGPHNRRRVPVRVRDASLKAWIIETEFLRKGIPHAYRFQLATASVQYPIAFPEPFERPPAPPTHCPTWWTSLEYLKPYSPQCPVEPEVYTLVAYPVALSGTYHGVHRMLPGYKNKYLEKERKFMFDKPRWTMEFWLYIVDYCPSGRSLCSILQRIKWDDLYMTPLIYINPVGQLHLQVVCENAEAIAHLTTFSVPKDQWVRLVVSLQNNRWFVTVNYGKDWKQEYFNRIMLVSKSPLWYDSAPALHVVGGTEITPSFQGYVGQARFYRRVVKEPKDLSLPRPDHPMFGLGIGEKTKRCGSYLSWIKYRIGEHQAQLEEENRARSCPAVPSVFRLARRLPLQCDLHSRPRSSAFRFARRWVRRQVRSGWRFRLVDVGEAIYRHATELIEEHGFDKMSDVVQQLKQSSCYGYHDASYMLATILSHGVGVKSDEIMSHHYLMVGALDNHRLSLMGLGNKHVYALDGMPQDLEQSYSYYKNTGDRSRRDREEHADDDVYTEAVRLTDERAISEQTDEDGDLFLWFRHQAAQGVVHAQRDLARMMFWGSQGVKRNLKAAAEYYRLSAESGEASALFDYGIVLLKGQGVPQNYTASLEYLRKAADKGHAGAMNAIGWYALEISHNYTEARDLFTRAANLSNADAMHNLGHMYLGGRYPGAKGRPDRINAFKYFSKAALMGQYDSSIMVAMYNIRGHPNATRDPDLAVGWARYVAEISPSLGRVLAKGLRAYRHNNWPAALLYYMLAADAGVEVGNFNLAWLCEENYEGITNFVEKECVWRFYRLATRREPQHVHPYSWIKLGDYHWYGCGGERNAPQAAIMYANGALLRDPHAIFNLAYLVEERIYVPDYVWKGLGIPQDIYANNVTLLKELYHRCKESFQTEAYIPCSLALLRVEVVDLWRRHHILIKLSSVLAVLVATVMASSWVHANLRARRASLDTV